MGLLLKTAVLLFAFTGIFLLGVSIDFKDTYRKIKGKLDESTKRIEQASSSEGPFGKLINVTEAMIQKSNIRMYIGYNSWMHFLICLSLGFLSFEWINKYISVVTSLAFALVVMFIPYIVLKLVSDFFSKKEKKNSIDFLVILKNFFMAGKNDIFEAFEKAARYINEPLRSYVELMVYEYKHKINALTCLENFKNKLGTADLRLYIDNLAICYVQGGDIPALTDTFIYEMSNLDEDDDKEDTEDRILGFGLYFLLLLNFLIIYWMINSTYKKEILGSLWGQVVFILDMLICIYIIYMLLEKD